MAITASIAQPVLGGDRKKAPGLQPLNLIYCMHICACLRTKITAHQNVYTKGGFRNMECDDTIIPTLTFRTMTLS